MRTPRLSPQDLAEAITEAANGVAGTRSANAILDLVDRIGADTRARIARADDIRDAILSHTLKAERDTWQWTADDGGLEAVAELLAWIYDHGTRLETPHKSLREAVEWCQNPQPERDPDEPRAEDDQP